jgi:hypothetical protein
VKDTDIACAYAKSNGFAITNAGRQNVTVTAGTGTVPTVSGVTVSYWVTVRVAETVPQFFSAVLGNMTGTISARATAAISGGSAGSCIYVLAPSMSGALSASNGVAVSATCGIFVNSSSSTAMTVTGGAAVTASTVQVVGNYSISNGGSINPTPITGAAPATDPFASLPAPSYSGCNYTNESVGYGTTTLSPGVYCNGISLANGCTVTFRPGIYILNGGGLNIAGGCTVTGSGVTFFNTANGYTYEPMSISNGTTVTLSAPTSGTYQGILFFQDRTISSSLVNSVAGGSTMLLTGSLYFPTTPLSYSNGISTAVTGIVAQSVSFSGGAHVAQDPTGGTETGLGHPTASLIE